MKITTSLNPQARDGAPTPLSATATVTVVVTDVNDEPPVCAPTSLTVSMTLLAKTQAPITTLQCTDRDVTPIFQQTGYSIVSPSQGMHQYVNEISFTF